MGKGVWHEDLTQNHSLWKVGVAMHAVRSGDGRVAEAASQLSPRPSKMSCL